MADRTEHYAERKSIKSGIVVVVRRNTEEKAAKPETLPIPSRKSEDMIRAKSTRKVSVCPGIIEMVVRITTAGVMSHPLHTTGSRANARCKL